MNIGADSSYLRLATYRVMATYRVIKPKWRSLWRLNPLLVLIAGIILAIVAIATPIAFSQTSRGLEVYAELPRGFEVGNIAITDRGRIFCSIHKFYGSPTRAIEVFQGNRWRTYPNTDWGQEPDAGGAPWAGLNNTLGIQSNGSNIVWFLDNPSAEFPTGRLVGWDTQKEALHRVIYLPQPASAENPFLNDLAVDTKHNAIYISDTASGADAALIVVDLNTGLARRVLQGHSSVQAEDIDMKIDGRVITRGGEPARIAVNPITIDPADEWVYYGAMSGTSIYRVRTRDLLNESLSDHALATQIERYGTKPISDGITVDRAGNVYITDITANAIGVTDAQGRYRVLYQEDRILSWPDGFAVGADGYIYGTINQLHRSPPLNAGEDSSTPPYRIIRFPSLAPSQVGR